MSLVPPCQWPAMGSLGPMAEAAAAVHFGLTSLSALCLTDSCHLSSHWHYRPLWVTQGPHVGPADSQLCIHALGEQRKDWGNQLHPHFPVHISGFIFMWSLSRLVKEAPPGPSRWLFPGSQTGSQEGAPLSSVSSSYWTDVLSLGYSLEGRSESLNDQLLPLSVSLPSSFSKIFFGGRSVSFIIIAPSSELQPYHSALTVKSVNILYVMGEIYNLILQSWPLLCKWELETFIKSFLSLQSLAFKPIAFP